MSIKDTIRKLPDDANILIQHEWAGRQLTKPPKTFKMKAPDLKALADSHDDLIKAANRLVAAHRNTVDNAEWLGAELALSKAIEEAEKL